MQLTEILKTIFFISMISCTKPSPNRTCFRLNGQPTFNIGGKLNMKFFTINFGLDERGKNYGKNNGLNDYFSVDSSLSITKVDGQIAGILSFTKADNTDKLISLNVFWMFMIGDSSKDRLAGLQAIKSKYLNCFNLGNIDILKGGEYKIKKNDRTETFTLAPRIRENGIDVNYWSFYYSIK